MSASDVSPLQGVGIGWSPVGEVTWTENSKRLSGLFSRIPELRQVFEPDDPVINWSLN